jgi:hypothetical protein
MKLEDASAHPDSARRMPQDKEMEVGLDLILSCFRPSLEGPEMGKNWSSLVFAAQNRMHVSAGRRRAGV